MDNTEHKKFTLTRCSFKNCWSTTGKNGGGGACDIYDTSTQTPISFCNFINCSVSDAVTPRCGG
jgi:hypothetical protein